MRRCLLVAAAVLAAVSAAAADPGEVGGYSPEEALRLGERMYREGVLPSGEPMMAVVMGDIPVDGRLFTCDDCHQRSGIGSKEGTIIAQPTNGKSLYQPRRRTQAWNPPVGKDPEYMGPGALPLHTRAADARPAYTDDTLAAALRTGVDPAGNKIDPAMPRYLLDAGDMEVMIHYLKNLCVDFSPGVDDKVLRLATVVSSAVPYEQRRSMLDVLQATVRVHNSQTRYASERAEHGVFYHSQKNRRYRDLDLQVWELQGPADTWRQQLEAFYAARPVFALVGGMAAGSWEPVHRFSEDHKLPCVFPLTELPVVSDTDWYTLYFSKGLYQEGEGAARFLRSADVLPAGARVVQVYREGTRGAFAARGFRETWVRFGGDFSSEGSHAPDAT